MGTPATKLQVCGATFSHCQVNGCSVAVLLPYAVATAVLFSASLISFLLLLSYFMVFLLPR